MNYNDFQIPNNHVLNKMLEEYNLTTQQPKYDSFNEVYSDLNILYSSCLLINKEYNNTIKQAIHSSKNTLNKCLENMLAVFNIKTQTITTVLNINVFDFILNIINILNKTNKWILIEKKPYIKTFIQKLNLELLNIIKNLISAINNSNFKFYKHM